MDAGAALELLHAFALIHDDVMDGSAQRRGAPSLHVELSDAHAARTARRGESRRFGEGMAVLAGDLALVYADRLMPRHRRGPGGLWDELRIELTMGQHLDLTSAADRRPGARAGPAHRRPQVGPLHRRAPPPPRRRPRRPLQRPRERPSAAYGEPLGQAFQLRDDLLGVFGDPADHRQARRRRPPRGQGHPALAIAHERADAAGRHLLDRVGRPDLGDDDIGAVQALIRRTGADHRVDVLIEQLLAQGLAALDGHPLTPEGRHALEALAVTAARRTS